MVNDWHGVVELECGVRGVGWENMRSVGNGMDGDKGLVRVVEMWIE